MDLAAVARLLADGTRAAFCLALLDGRAWSAGNVVYGRDATIGGIQRFWAGGLGSTLKTVSRFVEAPGALCVEATTSSGA